MSPVSTRTIRNVASVIVLLLLVASLFVWYGDRNPLPRTIHIATGEEGGLYFKLANSIRESLQQRTKREIAIESTRGSEDNFERLTQSAADLAIIQGGTMPIEELSVVTPLYPELVFVIVRIGSDVEEIFDLVGKNVAIGRTGSGHRRSSMKVLEHFHVDPDDLGMNDRYFKELLDEPALDAAIVTAGIEHPDLREVLATHQFDLLPIHSAPAIDLVHPFLRNMEIPRGLFAEHPPVPAEPIPTIATTAYLVTRNDAPDRLVEAALACIHEESLRLRVPTLVLRQEAHDWVFTRMHPVAQRYFIPEDNIGMMANVMESLAATKELLFAFGAGVYLLWIRWRRLKENELQRLISRQKEHLDRFLEETLRIEKSAMQTDETDKLREYIDEVTRIKLNALRQFTEEELRGDQSFTIFLDQCSSLINQIQMKLIAVSSNGKA